MDDHEQFADTKRARFSLSQESVTVLTVGLALAGLLLAHLGELRADRARLEATVSDMRAEVRASREAFEQRIIQLVEKQGTLNGLVDGLRNPIPSPEK